MESFIFLWKILFISQLLSVHLGNCELLVQAKAGDVRLVNPRDGKSREGIVMVFLDEDWHWISPDGFDQPTATVICQRAGFNGEGTPQKGIYYGPAPPAKILTCDGEEDTPLDCTVEDTEPEDGDYSVSYSANFHVWKNYTGAYVICNDLEVNPTPIIDVKSIVSIVLLVLIVALVIVLARIFHRRILGREMAKMTKNNPDDKNPNQAPTQYTAINRETGSSNQGKPATEETSFVGGDEDTATVKNPTYSRRMYEEHKGVNAGFVDEYACIDEAMDNKADH